jgi:cell division protein FtsI/penicillin-binding protein 2
MALVALGAGRAQSVTAYPPRTDLRHVTLGTDSATAPLAGGGTAELTLDAALQDASQRLLAKASPIAGAVVAVSPRSGRVLAWAERRRGPSQDSVILDEQAPVASLFKVVTTAALLESHAVSPGDEVCTIGGLRSIERRHLEPARGKGAQCDRFDHALGHSRNAVFAQLVTRHLAREDLLKMGGLFGFNGRVPFDVPANMGRLAVPYNDLAFARTAAGFENSSLTPLGAAYLGCVVASGGRALRLRIVARAGSYQAPEEAEVVGRVVSPETASALTRMMEVTVHSGTAREAFTDDTGASFLRSIRVAAKTGTLKPRADAPTTSWFVGFAPSRRPEIVVSVLLENGTSFRRHAKEVGRDVLRAWFSGRQGVTHPLLDALE